MIATWATSQNWTKKKKTQCIVVQIVYIQRENLYVYVCGFVLLDAFDFYVLTCVFTIVETTGVSRETPLDWHALKISPGKPGARMPCSEALTSIKHWHIYILVWTPCIMHRCVISTMFYTCLYVSHILCPKVFFFFFFLVYFLPIL